MKIAVTGGTGFIGNNLVSLLTRNDHSVRVLVRNQAPSLEGMPIEKVKGHLFDLDSLKQLATSADIFIHMASKISIDPRDEEALFRTNVGGVKNVIQACVETGVKRIIYFSSIHSLHNEGKDVPQNEDIPYAKENAGPYDRSKAAAEKLMVAARQKGINVNIVNPTGVMGPFDYAPSLIGSMIWKVYNNDMPFIVRGGFDWVDVRDVVKAVNALIDRNIENERIILSGHYYTLKEVAKIVSGVKNKKYAGMVIPLTLARMGLPFTRMYADIMGKAALYTEDSLRATENGSRFISSKKAEDMLDYTSRPFEESVRDTIAWMTKNLPKP